MEFAKQAKSEVVPGKASTFNYYANRPNMNLKLNLSNLGKKGPKKPPPVAAEIEEEAKDSSGQNSKEEK